MIIAAVFAVIAIVLVIAFAAYSGRHEYTKRRIRTAFGPEYARVRAEQGGTRAADRELARRSQMHDRLPLEPISANDREFYATSWQHIRGGFLDDPGVAVTSAAQLLTRLLEARGYPVDDQGEQLALLSVQHGPALADYRQALWVSERLRTNPASMPTEAKREALMQYQTLFEDLLTEPGAAVSRRIKESEVTP
ncbi:hypothetical protein KGQ20_12745 [Catenulispora sp. NF23]|uniref:hypothetical protein n=1 Tax=Catenulispora pinistramenti TaxID=2705254 RepID=UPI001BA4F068|nr:hypothetical protein [Catenulispora pinistramenti]MBS2533639.1 hypothetical protein [Catenulispora pinistramenti]